MKEQQSLSGRRCGSHLPYPASGHLLPTRGEKEKRLINDMTRKALLAVGNPPQLHFAPGMPSSSHFWEVVPSGGFTHSALYRTMSMISGLPSALLYL